jgi:hypothetical protein
VKLPLLLLLLPEAPPVEVLMVAPEVLVWPFLLVASAVLSAAAAVSEVLAWPFLLVASAVLSAAAAVVVASAVVAASAAAVVAAAAVDTVIVTPADSQRD